MVSRLAFGGIPIQRLSRQEGIRLVADAIDLGIIATKSPAADRKGFLADLDESLRRLGTDYVDVFQFHVVSSRERMAHVMGPGGAMEGMVEGVRAGKIRFPAFSSHSLPIAVEMIGTGRFDAVQAPFNFVDSQAADEVFPLARQADMASSRGSPWAAGSSTMPVVRYAWSRGFLCNVRASTLMECCVRRMCDPVSLSRIFASETMACIVTPWIVLTSHVLRFTSSSRYLLLSLRKPFAFFRRRCVFTRVSVMGGLIGLEMQSTAPTSSPHCSSSLCAFDGRIVHDQDGGILAASG
jgi:hypothetical protein